MKYVFILGRNSALSQKEVECYLERVGNPILKSSLIKNGFFVDVAKEISGETVNNLGGVLSIGKVLGEVDGLEKIMIYSETKNNINYSLWDFSKNYDLVLEYLKGRFKEEKLKAVYKGLSDNMKMQDKTFVEVPSAKLIDEEYFVFDFEGKEYFGRVFQKCDYEEIERRDMERPMRRPSLDISPRLAKIMINFRQ